MDEQVGERRLTSDRRRSDRRRSTVEAVRRLQDRRRGHGIGGRRRIDGKRRGRPEAVHAGPVVGVRQAAVPFLLTVDEVAEALRTTRKAVYALIERGHLPGVVRVRRRILVRQSVLLQWLQEKGAPSLRETER
jgi:excisionase family DNA binding protein